MSALQLDAVGKKYDKVVALRDLSMAIEPGEMFGLIGPDGAGKTTTIRLMCGLLKPDAGSVRVLGRDPVKEHLAVTQTLGYLSQRFSLYGDLSIDENISFFAEIHGLSMRDPAIRERRERLLELTQLATFRSRLAEQLSGGMKQKLALACTLVHEPRIILLDEPTTGVDPVSRREFWKLLSEFLAQGITILMATPYLDEAERCSRVALLHEGQLVALDTPAHLRAGLPGIVIEVIAVDRDRATSVLERFPASSMSAVRRARPCPPRRRRAARQSGRAGVGAETGRCRCRKHPSRPRIARRCVHRSSRKGNRMKPPISVLLLFLVAANAASAQAPPLRLTLDEAVARGIEASHRLEELSARQDAAQAIEDQRAAAGVRSWRRWPATRGSITSRNSACPQAEASG
jgi:ABC-2 type transport system ATP-binding protein